MTETIEIKSEPLKWRFAAFALLLGSPLAVQADEPAATNASPTIQPAPIKLHSQWRKKEVELPAWPGSFIAIRAGLSAGEVLVPFASGSGFSGGPNGSHMVTSFTSLAPLIGAELGYCPKNWGASFSIDWLPVGLLSADFFSGAPSELVLTFNLIYAANDKLRWDFGIEPYNTYSVGLPSSGSATINGVGLKVGAHFRVTDRGPRVWSIFVSGSGGVLREVNATVDGVTTGVSPNSSGFGGTFMGYFALTSGAEWSFSL